MQIFPASFKMLFSVGENSITIEISSRKEDGLCTFCIIG